MALSLSFDERFYAFFFTDFCYTTVMTIDVQVNRKCLHLFDILLIYVIYTIYIYIYVTGNVLNSVLYRNPRYSIECQKSAGIV